jgi:hypothetical protein
MELTGRFHFGRNGPGFDQGPMMIHVVPLISEDACADE